LCGVVGMCRPVFDSSALGSFGMKVGRLSDPW
jgi:hypothetical protein